MSRPNRLPVPAEPAGGPVPARPLAAQAHALRAVAALLEHTGLAGLALSFHAGQISIQVPVDLADPATRTAAVGLLAAALGTSATRQHQPGPTHGWIRAHGHLAGHPTRVFTAIEATVRMSTSSGPTVMV